MGGGGFHGYLFAATLTFNAQICIHACICMHGNYKRSPIAFKGFGLVYWGLTPQQQPVSYQGGEMMMKSVFWWRKPEYPKETTDLRQVAFKGGSLWDVLSGEMRNLPTLIDFKEYTKQEQNIPF